MAKMKFELNSAGVVELMKSAQMQSILNEYGAKVASRAGDGYSAENIMSGDRAKIFVQAETPKAKSDNLKNNTLLKALGGRG